MLLPNRRFLLTLPLALAACGFQPVYGPGGSGNALQNRVSVDAPDDRASYLLVRELETKLGRSSSPTYALSLKLKTTQDGLAVDRQGNINRYNLIGAVEYSLSDLQSGQIITSGKTDNFTGYSATGTTVATLAAERDAQSRLMTILADQIITRLFAADLPQ